MVVRSFRIARISKEVGKKKANNFKTEILKLYGDRIEVNIKDKKIIIEGEGLSDHRIFDALTFIITEGKHGKNV